MKKVKAMFTLAMAFVAIHSNGQSMTYNHDDSKQAQIEVMELGSGTLTPEIYYKTTHNSYRKGAKAATSVKNQLRISANTSSLPQVDYADSIKSDLEGRAKVEVTNVADREVDMAWLTEGGKIEEKLMAMKSNVSYLTGKAKQDEIDSWEELGKMYDFAIKVTKKAYMPNSERQKQYLAILDEITASNDYLLLRIRYLTTKSKADKLVATMARFQHRIGENATASYNRWRDSANDAGHSKIEKQ